MWSMHEAGVVAVVVTCGACMKLAGGSGCYMWGIHEAGGEAVVVTCGAC